MARHWIFEEGKYGPRMVMKGPWSERALKAARSHGVKELELNHAKGWSGNELSFLKDLSNLEAFSIIDFTINDVAGVNELTSLRSLNVSTYCKTELRFSQFPKLEGCALDWRPKATSLFEHRGLRTLSISKYPGKDMNALANLTHLKAMSLYSPGRLETLKGIEALTSLKFLGLYVARRLTSLAGVEELTGLERLEVHTCRKVGDIAPVAALKGLKELFLPNCGDIETLKPLVGLKELEKFIFYESTNVLDGDLSGLESLPKLKDVAFMNRRHYSHKREDMPAYWGIEK